MGVIYIGSAVGDEGIYARLWNRVEDPQHYFDPGSKEAWRSGLTIKVSWAVTADKAAAKQHEAALIEEYYEKHNHLPCVVLDGKPIPANKQRPTLKGTPADSLSWSEWAPLYRVSYSRDASIRLFESVPRLPGVYRFQLSGSEWGCLWETDSKKAESLKQSAPGEPVCLTQYPAVREYWGRTGRGDRNAHVRQVGMCSKCNVIFPKGTGGGGNCALCV